MRAFGVRDGLAGPCPRQTWQFPNSSADRSAFHPLPQARCPAMLSHILPKRFLRLRVLVSLPLIKRVRPLANHIRT